MRYVVEIGNKLYGPFASEMAAEQWASFVYAPNAFAPKVVLPLHNPTMSQSEVFSTGVK